MPARASGDLAAKRREQGVIAVPGRDTAVWNGFFHMRRPDKPFCALTLSRGG